MFIIRRDISSCEGKDYVQLYYHDSFQSSYDHQSYSSSTSTFQDPTGTSPLEAPSMFNSYFNGNQTKNGTNYCFDSGAAANTFGASATCSLNYSLNDAKPNHLEKHLTRAVPTYNDTSNQKNILLPSNIKQSYRAGLEADFMWMHLNKPSATLSYSPPENNASGFNSGANANEKVLNGDLNAEAPSQ